MPLTVWALTSWSPASYLWSPCSWWPRYQSCPPPWSSSSVPGESWPGPAFPSSASDRWNLETRTAQVSINTSLGRRSMTDETKKCVRVCVCVCVGGGVGYIVPVQPMSNLFSRSRKVTRNFDFPIFERIISIVWAVCSEHNCSLSAKFGQSFHFERRISISWARRICIFQAWNCHFLNAESSGGSDQLCTWSSLNIVFLGIYCVSFSRVRGDFRYRNVDSLQVASARQDRD